MQALAKPAALTARPHVGCACCKRGAARAPAAKPAFAQRSVAARAGE